MRDDTGILKAGMAVVFSHGCYSDYTFGQVYVVSQDFNYMDEAKKYAFEFMEKKYEEGKEDFYISSYDLDEHFESYLIKKGFLILCENREIHTGDYSFFDDEWIRQFKEEKGIEE